MKSMHLHMAACSQHGEPILPSSTSLPDPSSQPQNDSAVVSGHFDRMESELKVLQQQAQATQQSIKQLQTREAVDPWTAIRSDLAATTAVDASVVAVVGLIMLALALVWWYLWHRPQTTPLEAELTVLPDKEVESVAMPAHSPAPSPSPQQTPVKHSAEPIPSRAFGQREPGMGFDPQAAANEVTRVRKSLAGKREARSLSLEREDMQGVNEWQAHQERPPLEFDLELEPEPEHDEPISFTLPPHPLVPESESAPQPETIAQPAGAPPMTLATEPPLETERVTDAVPESESEPEPEQSAGYDYSITLALAEESEALELWTEARELAREVLQSTDPDLQSHAQALLDRLDSLENATRQESRMWDEPR